MHAMHAMHVLTDRSLMLCLCSYSMNVCHCLIVLSCSS